MKRSRWKALLLAGIIVLGALGAGGFLWTRGHMREKTGRRDIQGVTCSNCHGRSAEDFAWLGPRRHHPAPEGLAVSSDGRRLYVACADSDQVLLLDPDGGETLAAVHLDGGPTGLALDEEHDSLFVTLRRADAVARLRASDLLTMDVVPVGREPLGLALASRAGEVRLVVANSGSDDLSLLDAVAFREITRLVAGREPYAVTAGRDDTAVLVANRLARVAAPEEPPRGEATLVDPWRPGVSRRWPLLSGHLSEGAALVPGRTWGLVSMVRVRNLLPITQVAEGWVMSSGIALLDEVDGTAVQLPLDEVNAYFADPSTIAVDRDGRRAYVASGGADVVTVLDLDRVETWYRETGRAAREQAADDLQLASDYVITRIRTGPNPRFLTLSPDGATLYVAEHLGDAVLAVDTGTLQPRSRLALGPDREPDAIWRGARVFASARTSFQGQFSCRSCHPDGHVDGLVYDFDVDGLGRNYVDNRSLRGVAGTAPFKWNGGNASLEVQCGVRFARVLTRTDPLEGRDLQDLVAYIRSLPPLRPGLPGDEQAVRRGHALFLATRLPDGREIPVRSRCVTCHPPPYYSTGLTARVHDPAPMDDSEEFDIPHLLAVGSSAPYLHDGRAATLEEIWTVHNAGDTHGLTSTFTKHDLNDLVEFLRSL